MSPAIRLSSTSAHVSGDDGIAVEQAAQAGHEAAAAPAKAVLELAGARVLDHHSAVGAHADGAGSVLTRPRRARRSSGRRARSPRPAGG